MKTSYCLVAAAGLTAAAVTLHGRVPLRAEAPAATKPMPGDPVVLAPATVPAMPAVPALPLPPIVPPPEGALVVPAGSPAPLPALPGTPAPAPLPTTPPLPAIPVPAQTPEPPAATPAVPVVPPAPAIPGAPPITKPVVPPPGSPAAPAVPAIPSVPIVSPNAGGPVVAPAPAPVIPSAPPEPKPLPLPAPTKLAPGSGAVKPAPAAELPPAGQFVVLKGNRLVAGTAKVAGDTVIVRQGALDRAFAKTDVLFVAASREEVVRHMLAGVAIDNADARLAVARWCTLNGLREQALAEARAILAIQPGHRGATELARSVEESLRKFPADGSRPKPAGELTTVVEPEADVTAEGATSFATRAQPILANQCMECHARDDHPGAFRLKRVTGFEVGPHSTHANLRAVARQLRKDDPAASPLLVKALVAHGGMKQPAFVSRQAVPYRMLEAWVAVAVGSGTTQPMTPPAEPVVPAPPAVTPILPTNPAAASAPAQPAAPVVSRPALPPVEPAPTNPLKEAPSSAGPVIPPVLPTPPSIPSAQPGGRTTPALPTIPAVPPPGAGAKAPAPLPAMPTAANRPKPPGEFGTGSKPPEPPGVDEFDPAAFNRTAPAGK